MVKKAGMFTPASANVFAASPSIRARKSAVVVKFTKLDGNNSFSKAKLVASNGIIKDTIDRNSWNQTTAARIMSTDQPKISQICNDKVGGFSLKRLIFYIVKLGFVVTILVKGRPKDQTGGRNRKYETLFSLDIDSVQSVSEEKKFLANVISNIMEDNCWNQDEAAKVFGVDQPKVSQICSGNLMGFSVERFKAFILAAGYKLEMLIKQCEDCASSGKLCDKHFTDGVLDE